MFKIMWNSRDHVCFQKIKKNAVVQKFECIISMPMFVTQLVNVVKMERICWVHEKS